METLMRVLWIISAIFAVTGIAIMVVNFVVAPAVGTESTGYTFGIGVAVIPYVFTSAIDHARRKD